MHLTPGAYIIRPYPAELYSGGKPKKDYSQKGIEEERVRIW